MAMPPALAAALAAKSGGKPGLADAAKAKLADKAKSAPKGKKKKKGLPPQFQ